MEVKDRVIVVTGAGRGIGAAMCRVFAEAGCKAVVVSDRDEAAAASVALGIGPQAVANRCDVALEADVQHLITHTVAQFGRVDIFCSNAGITVKGGVESSNSDWQHVGHQRDVASVCCAGCSTSHAGTWRRLSDSHGIGRRTPHGDRFRILFRH